MKKPAFTLVLLSCLASSNVMATDNKTAIQERVEQVKSEFNLNEQQAKRITAILTQAGMSKEEKRAARMEKRIQRRVEHMTQKLELSDNQAVQLKDILVQQNKQIQELRAQGKADITAILTPEQASRFAKMRTNRKGWHGKHRKRGGHGSMCNKH
ncbi:MAG: hypothetical protein ACPGVP_15030 [Thiolinea sp.]